MSRSRRLGKTMFKKGLDENARGWIPAPQKMAQAALIGLLKKQIFIRVSTMFYIPRGPRRMISTTYPQGDLRESVRPKCGKVKDCLCF